MLIMEQYTTHELTIALQEDIADADSGIVVRPIDMHWGTLIDLERQGKSRGWKVYVNLDGSSRIHHPKSASIPEIDLYFEVGDLLGLRDTLIHCINRGWI